MVEDAEPRIVTIVSAKLNGNRLRGTILVSGLDVLHIELIIVHAEAMAVQNTFRNTLDLGHSGHCHSKCHGNCHRYDQ